MGSIILLGNGIFNTASFFEYVTLTVKQKPPTPNISGSVLLPIESINVFMSLRVLGFTVIFRFGITLVTASSKPDIVGIVGIVGIATVNPGAIINTYI